MSLAAWSVTALLVALVLSCVTNLNIGVLALGLAFIVGTYIGGIPVNTVMAGFPSQLFLTLAGVTLLFSIAQGNGSLDRLAHRAVLGCRGNRGLIPIMFFVLAASLASIGPGNIATAALIAPMAMTTAGRVGIPLFLMAIMVGNGANAGSLSPFAPTGIIVSGLMTKIGLPGLEQQTYLYNLSAHALVAFGGYFLFGGWKLFAPERKTDAAAVEHKVEAVAGHEPFEARHAITLAVIALLILGVILFNVNVGMGAFAASVVLVLLRCGDDKEAIKKMPWNVIVMVCGVTVLIAVLEKAEGIELIVSYLARVATRALLTAEVALVTGLVSVYSSTSGVVLPAFLPMAPGLAEQVGGASPFAIAMAMNVGGHLVDVSPLSTIGALCIAAAPTGSDTRGLFNKLLAWGLSMAVVGGIVCWLLFN